MGVFEQFPYANMHEMNLDWLLKKMKELAQTMETFKATESLKFADPIIWDITTQYEKSTIVLDPTGNAYLSLQAVPAGIQLNNDEYWLEIFNFTDYTRTANQNLTVNTETNTTRATAAYAVDDWLIWNDVLYRVTAAIAIDDALIVAPEAGSNIVHFTVEDFIKAFITYATGIIQQYKDDIDASELAYRQQLAQDIASTTASLQAQLNAAIAGATVDSEVINARVGWDNTIYNTLGDAIRTQINELHNIIIMRNGSIRSTQGQSITDTVNVANRICSDLIYIPDYFSAIITFIGDYDMCLYDVSIDGNTISYTNGGQVAVPPLRMLLAGGRYYRFAFKKSDDSAISPKNTIANIEIISRDKYGSVSISNNLESIDLTEYAIMNVAYASMANAIIYTVPFAERIIFRPLIIPASGTYVLDLNMPDTYESVINEYNSAPPLTGQPSYVYQYKSGNREIVLSPGYSYTIQIKGSNIELSNIKATVKNMGISTRDYIESEENDGALPIYMPFIQGNTNPTNGGSITITTRCTHASWVPIPTNKHHVIIECDDNLKVRVTFSTVKLPSASTILYHPYNMEWHVGYGNFTIPDGAKWLKVSIAYIDDSDITPNDLASVKVYLTKDQLLKGAILSILGDSISTFAGYDAVTDPDGHKIADGTYTYAGNHCRYPNGDVNFVYNCYWYALIHETAMKLGVNESWAASRITWDGVTESSDIGATKYIGSQTRIDHLGENSTPDLILVEGGINDILNHVPVGVFNTESPKDYTDQQIADLDVSTFANGYRAMLIRLLKTYPSSEIVCLMPNYVSMSITQDVYKPYLDIIKEACEYFGVKYIDARDFGIGLYNSSTYLYDGVHPSSKGMYKIAEDLIKHFNYNIAI